ncbi:hypothetical protein CFC21_048322, partial [Triticum aestivum]
GRPASHRRRHDQGPRERHAGRSDALHHHRRLPRAPVALRRSHGGEEPLAGGRRARSRGERQGGRRQGLRGGRRGETSAVRQGWREEAQEGVRVRDGRRRGRGRGLGRDATGLLGLVRAAQEIVRPHQPLRRQKTGEQDLRGRNQTPVRSRRRRSHNARDPVPGACPGGGVLSRPCKIRRDRLRQRRWRPRGACEWDSAKIRLGGSNKNANWGSSSWHRKRHGQIASACCQRDVLSFRRRICHYQRSQAGLGCLHYSARGKTVFSVLSTTWGLVADVDIESEKYRWMGSARFDFYALVRIMNLRRYRGSVHFVPAPGYEAYGDPVKQAETPIVEQNGESRVCSYQGPRAEFQCSDWRSIDGPFVGVCVYNVPWAAENAMAAPEAKFSDGYMDAVILKDCPKADLLALLLKMSDGSYVKSPHVTYFKVKSFRLSPGQLMEDPKRGGIVDVDGEVVARGEGTYGMNQDQDLMAYGPSVQLTVHQGLATVYCPK